MAMPPISGAGEWDATCERKATLGGYVSPRAVTPNVGPATGYFYPRWLQHSLPLSKGLRTNISQAHCVCFRGSKRMGGGARLHLLFVP